MINEISQELAQRMARFVRHCAGTSIVPPFGHSSFVEAQQLASLLPKPVDPLLFQARKIVADICSASGANASARGFLMGNGDEQDEIKIALAALKSREQL